MNIHRNCFYGNNDCNCNVSKSFHIDYAASISRETHSVTICFFCTYTVYMNKHTAINIYGRKEDEKEKEKDREKRCCGVCIFKSVSMHVLLLLRVRWRMSFPQRLLHWSVSQSDLYQEVNAVRAWKIAWALLLMGNIWYSLRNGMMFFFNRAFSQPKKPINPSQLKSCRLPRMLKK